MTKLSRNNGTLGNGVRYSGARAMKVHVDESGNWWLCDRDVKSDGNFAQQGCWRYDTMPFDRND